MAECVSAGRPVGKRGAGYDDMKSTKEQYLTFLCVCSIGASWMDSLGMLVVTWDEDQGIW